MFIGINSLLFDINMVSPVRAGKPLTGPTKRPVAEPLDPARSPPGSIPGVPG